jgi:uncharacterized protein with HEPN domain
MQPRSAKLLEDIRDAGQTIIDATAGKRLDDYLNDRLLRLAVERCFEIIGEAMRRLDEHDHQTASQISHIARIIAFRNILIHGYSLVKHELVWSVIQHQLPKLMNEVEALLQGRGGTAT